ncbi:MAG: DegT/DnrJ/EryC1/StrS family aminotransferase [Patescibacteria group bacterium]
MKRTTKKHGFVPKKLILTAGPSISQKEVRYVMDAVKNGWNEHAFDYMNKFEKAFAEYVGVKHAMSTAGGTCALHLALATLGIGPGDEVIIPEITYFACSDVVMLLGAKPVFVDVLKDTWCIDPEAVKKVITKRTKAVMPVDIYGNPHEVDEIKRIAKEYNLYVVEDACPAAGTEYKGTKMGSQADFGAYSFQGAKIMVTGIGGMLVTDNTELYERALHLNDHGEAKGYKGFTKKFWQTDVGYEFWMSNLQAALGLAQLERIEEFVAKKRQIFNWYHERLGDIEGISMNQERPNTKSNRWMTSIILDRDFGMTRDELRARLKERLIDTRPFFYPISMFPIYKEANTPVAHHVGLNGINLPSGLALTEEKVDYVTRMLREIILK